MSKGNSVAGIQERIGRTAFAFRGYNVTNLGRSHELLHHPQYGPIVEQYLLDGSRVCREVTGRKSNLVARVRRQRETTLKSYTEAISLIAAMSMAQLHLAREFHGVQFPDARLAFGYSLGEIVAVSAAGVFDWRDSIRVPLALAQDCVRLAHDVRLGVLFSRGPQLPIHEVNRLCLRINAEGDGVIGISAYLSPNSLLLLGQRDTLQRFKNRLEEIQSDRIFLRENDNRWPPMHTPIVWEQHIPNRASLLMHSLPGGFVTPDPPILSMVTGALSYNDYNAREILSRWTDHPQRLWDVVYQTLASGVEVVVHVGPEPNLVPATFKRLADNVKVQLSGSIGLRAMSNIVGRPWLQSLLPERTALLRAPMVKQIHLEDWLLARQPAEK